MRLGTSGPEHYTRTKFLLYEPDIEHSQYVLSIFYQVPVTDVFAGGN